MERETKAVLVGILQVEATAAQLQLDRAQKGMHWRTYLETQAGALASGRAGSRDSHLAPKLSSFLSLASLLCYTC